MVWSEAAKFMHPLGTLSRLKCRFVVVEQHALIYDRSLIEVAKEEMLSSEFCNGVDDDTPP